MRDKLNFFRALNNPFGFLLIGQPDTCNLSDIIFCVKQISLLFITKGDHLHFFLCISESTY